MNENRLKASEDPRDIRESQSKAKSHRKYPALRGGHATAACTKTTPAPGQARQRESPGSRATGRPLVPG
jgi:hypothetical protein